LEKDAPVSAWGLVRVKLLLESPKQPVCRWKGHLEPELHLESQGRTSRIVVAFLVDAPGIGRRAVEPSKAQRLALIPLPDPTGRCLRHFNRHGLNPSRQKMVSNGRGVNELTDKRFQPESIAVF
jgi:hypothetical protein